MNNLLYDIYPLLPEIFVILCVCFLLVCGVLFSTSSGYPILTKVFGLITFQIVVFSFLLSFFQKFQNSLICNDFLVCDLFTFNIKYFLILVFASWFFTTFSYTLYERINSFEYWILVLLALVALLFIIQSYDFLTIYLSIEFQSLILYILASFKRTSEFSTESGLKYFILGAFSSALLLFGISLVYGVTGLTNLGDLSKMFTNIIINDMSVFNGVVTGLTLILVSFLFKLSAVPFHMWAPDVYEGAPTCITAFFSIMPKLPILVLLCRFLIFGFYDWIDFWYIIILTCVLLSVLMGTFSTLKQTKWKRFFAYSSISHVGFFLLPLLLGNQESVSNSVFYVCIYIITIINVFSIILSLRFYNSYHYQIRHLRSISGLAKINPIISLTFSLILFSMAGIPPLAGFFSKVFVLLSSLQASAIGISVFAVVMSCIACFYYIKLIKTIYFDKQNHYEILYPINKCNSIILALTFLFTILLFFDIELISLFSIQASLAFLN